MKSWAEDQAEFMKAGDQTLGEVDWCQADRYLRHMIEEVSETNDAFSEMDWLKAIDGAVDTIVVAIGFLHSLNIDPDKAWRIVHAANMRKIVNGKIYRRADGQIGKPPGWYGPEEELKQLL